jgi:transposase
VSIDEVAWAQGHTYFTLVYDIGGETKRLLAVEEDRIEVNSRSCLESLGELVRRQIEYVCSDM